MFYVTGDSSMVRPPPLPAHMQASNQQLELYDSTVDNENNPQIFVIYAMEKCYPSYLIMYRDRDEYVKWKTFKKSGTPQLPKIEYELLQALSDGSPNKVRSQKTVTKPAATRSSAQAAVVGTQRATPATTVAHCKTNLISQ